MKLFATALFLALCIVNSPVKASPPPPLPMPEGLPEQIDGLPMETLWFVHQAWASDLFEARARGALEASRKQQARAGRTDQYSTFVTYANYSEGVYGFAEGYFGSLQISCNNQGPCSHAVTVVINKNPYPERREWLYRHFRPQDVASALKQIPAFAISTYYWNLSPGYRSIFDGFGVLYWAGQPTAVADVSNMEIVSGDDLTCPGLKAVPSILQSIIDVGTPRNFDTAPNLPRQPNYLYTHHANKVQLRISRGFALTPNPSNELFAGAFDYDSYGGTPILSVMSAISSTLLECIRPQLGPK